MNLRGFLLAIKLKLGWGRHPLTFDRVELEPRSKEETAVDLAQRLREREGS